MRNNKINAMELANDSNTSAPKFNFYNYQINKKYYNNTRNIDFVTYNGSLYVCTEDGVYATESNIENQSGFLCIVKKGADGRRGIDGAKGEPGAIPEIGAKFDGTKLVIYEKNGNRLSSSPDLSGPTWMPKLENHKITWELEDGTPDDIDLDLLRPVEERPVLFRLDSDNTKRSDEESGPGYYIQ